LLGKLLALFPKKEREKGKKKRKRKSMRHVIIEDKEQGRNRKWLKQ
jgi:hypothetical protein